MEGKADWEPTYNGRRMVTYRCLGAQLEVQRVWADAVKTVKEAWRVLAPVIGNTNRLKQSDFALSNPLPHEHESRRTQDAEAVPVVLYRQESDGAYVGPSGHKMERCARAFLHQEHDWDTVPLNPREESETRWCPGYKVSFDKEEFPSLAEAMQEPVAFGVDERQHPVLAIQLGQDIPSERCRAILNGPLCQAVNLFVERNAEYGEDGANQLGLGGQFADINRKVLKLKRAMWDGESTYNWSEQPDEIMMDLIGHLLLSIQMYREGER